MRYAPGQFEVFEDAPHYGSAEFPPPRPFQTTAHEKLRQGVRDGHKCQMLMSPTGSGKSYLGMRVAHEALAKGRRATFVCDRTTLINQTSDVAFSYGLSAHGVIQSNHPLYNPSLPFQIASVQTLARRDWPKTDVIIIDEAHTMYAAWVEHIKTCTAKVIGLSATPFSTGLGKLFTNLVNAATMHELTQQGILVPMRVFSCTTADMTGAETANGEWTDKAAAERGSAIIGDVVSEWIKFGEGRKTIVFGPTIAYCAELCQQFNDAGIMAATFTGETPEHERKELTQEFRKPDSRIRVLVSVEALAKGWDQKDVSCVVDCRPLRKSLSTAIQMWGRGLRCSPETGKTDCLLLDHCIASGQKVLTHRGLVCIEEILLTDKLWDGHEFVTHKGVISRGIKPVIQYAGLTATADHPVKTAQGWRTLGQCADEQTAIVTTGVGRTALWERDGYFTGPTLAGPAGTAIRSCALRVRGLWVSLRNLAHELAERTHEGMSILQSAGAVSEVALCAGARHETALHESEGSTLQRLRRERDRVPFRLRDYLRTVGSGQPWDSGRSGIYGVGSEGQQRSLRAGQHSVVHQAAEHEQHAGQQVVAADAQVQASTPGSALRGRLTALLAFCRAVIRGNRGTMGETFAQTEREVWDILDCGPRNSFTCEGLLVHNSGNIIRFREDFEDIYFNGLSELDMGEKLDKVVRKDDEDKEPKGCPSCGTKPFFKHCVVCGFEIVKPSLIEAQAGVMREVMLGKKKLADNRMDMYAQCVTYARGHSTPDKQAGRAAHIYKDIVGEWPPREWRFDETPNVTISANTLNKIRANNIRYVKGKAKSEGVPA